MLRKRFADPNDIFLIQFAAWHNKLGPPGIESMKVAMDTLGKDHQVRVDYSTPSPLRKSLCAGCGVLASCSARAKLI